MSGFDGRHKWGEVLRHGARITRVCRACGKSVTYETLIPDSFVDAVIANAARPNPYRDLFQR